MSERTYTIREFYTIKAVMKQYRLIQSISIFAFTTLLVKCDKVDFYAGKEEFIMSQENSKQNPRFIHDQPLENSKKGRRSQKLVTGIRLRLTKAEIQRNVSNTVFDYTNGYFKDDKACF